MLKYISAVALLALLVPSAGLADVLVSTPTGAFFGGWTADNDGAEFWDNVSDDGTNCNIGFWMTGTQSGCSNISPGSAITPTGTYEFLAGEFPAGTPNPAVPVSSFYFQNTGLPDNAVTLQVEVAGYRNANSFGWYDTSDTSTLYQLFTGGDNPQLVATFTPTNSFGFYLKSPDGTFLTSTTDNFQHFAVFAEDPSSPSAVANAYTLNSFWLGMEDRIRQTDTDFDYQDMVVKISEVPEPGFYGVLALGLAGLYGFARRRRRGEEA